MKRTRASAGSELRTRIAGATTGGSRRLPGRGGLGKHNAGRKRHHGSGTKQRSEGVVHVHLYDFRMKYVYHPGCVMPYFRGFFSSHSIDSSSAESRRRVSEISRVCTSIGAEML